MNIITTPHLAPAGLSAHLNICGTVHSLALMGISPTEFDNTIIPLVAIVGAFMFTVFVIAIGCFARHQRHKMANDTLRLMIERGQPITSELVDSLKSRQPRGSDYSSRDTRKGLILLGVGVGLIVLCGRAGWIVFFIGLAFLLVGLLNVGKRSRNGVYEQPFNKDINQPPKI